MTQLYPPLYQYDENGSLRVWYMERDNDKYCTISGLYQGQKVTSAWKLATSKNIGKANATTGDQQAEAEIASMYQKRRDSGYTDHIPSPDDESKFFEPMLAYKYGDMKRISFPVWSQPKLDGIRCIVNHKGMWSRGGKPIIACPHIFEEFRKVYDVPLNKDLTFDGELYNHKFRDDFNKIVSLVKKTKPTAIEIAEAADLVEYHIYDMHNAGQKTLPFSGRSSSINVFFDTYVEENSKLVKVETFNVTEQHQLDQLYSVFLEDRYEGQMLRYDTPYEHKRTKNLLKRKEFIDDEFVVLDILEGKGNWAGIAKIVVLQLHDGSTCEAGIRGTQAYLYQVLQEKDKFIGNPAKVRFQNYTPDGKLRFPVVIELNRTM